MAVTEELGEAARPGLVSLQHRFQLIAFDWDGTAVENRGADARPVGRRLETLLKLGVRVVIITGTNFNNVNRQYCALVTGPHKRNLFICTNRGSEVFGFDAAANPIVLHRRQATTVEDAQLTEVAEAVRDEIERRSGVEIAIVYDRLNRRKIDLIPVPEWADPPKSEIGALLQATEERLARGGWRGGIKEAFHLAEETAQTHGLPDCKITSDVKHLELGLTDKTDSVAWVMRELVEHHGLPPSDVLFVGDEFGPIAGFEGSDFKMVTPLALGAVYASVGPEPNGVPPEVVHLGGGPARFLQLLDEQIVQPQPQCSEVW